jgi:hypothetical protein
MTGAWREFTLRSGQRVRHRDFAAFITATPPFGLGATVALVRRIVAGDMQAMDLLERAMHRLHGSDRRSESYVPVGGRRRSAGAPGSGDSAEMRRNCTPTWSRAS